MRIMLVLLVAAAVEVQGVWAQRPDPPVAPATQAVERLERMETRLIGLEKQLGRSTQSPNAFNNVERRLSDFDKRLKEVERKIQQMESRLRTVEAKR